MVMPRSCCSCRPSRFRVGTVHPTAPSCAWRPAVIRAVFEVVVVWPAFDVRMTPRGCEILLKSTLYRVHVFTSEDKKIHHKGTKNTKENTKR